MRNLILILSLFITAACAHKHKFDNATVSNEPGGLETTLMTIKNKGDKMDIMLSFRNEYPFPVIIQENAVKVEFAGSKNSGLHRHNSRTLLRTGDWKEHLVVPRFLQELPKWGRGQVTVDHIYKEDNGRQGERLPPLSIAFELRDHQNN